MDLVFICLALIFGVFGIIMFVVDIVDPPSGYE